MPEIRVFRASDEPGVIALWEACELVVPHNTPTHDIARKVAFQPDFFLVAEADGGDIVGSVMAGYEGHRGWINYLAVAPSLQGGGLGRELMSVAEEKLLAAGCPKVNLQVRSSNERVIAFYEKLGYSVEERASLGKRLAQKAR
jgi:ribosomal protein S18 acetylase RimI-like enzyme